MVFTKYSSIAPISLVIFVVMIAPHFSTSGQVMWSESFSTNTLYGANISSAIDSAIEDVIITKAEVRAGHLDIAMDRLDIVEENLLSLRGENTTAIAISDEVTTPVSIDNETENN